MIRQRLCLTAVCLGIALGGPARLWAAPAEDEGGLRPTPPPRETGDPRPAPPPREARGERLRPAPPPRPAAAPRAPVDAYGGATRRAPRPAPPAAPRGFGDRGGVEVGGLFGFDYVYDNGTTTVHRMRVAAELYAGWFPVRRFVLGLYFAVNATRDDYGDVSLNAWGVATGAMLAPGLAFRIAPAWVVYGDLLVGGYYVRVKTLSNGGYAAVGAELGVKARLAPGAWLRLGLRPVGYIGRVKSVALGLTSDLRQFALLLRVGVSAYFL